jgi:TonB family protein
VQLFFVHTICLTVVYSLIYFGDGYFYPKDLIHMRRIVMAALALSPMLLHAQANLPAPAQSSASAPSLHAELGEPKEFSSSDSRTATTSVTPVRVSTGVTAPKLIHAENISTQGDVEWTVIPMHRTAVVELIVDADGKPSNIKVVHSLGMAMDKNVLEAVSQYRFKPGTVSHQPIPSPVSLEIDVHNRVY